MTTARKTAAKKTAAKKTASKTAKAPEPMDDTVTEVAEPTPHANRQRECYAMTTLVSEVAALHATSHQPMDYDRFNAALTVVFNDLPEDVQTCLVLAQADERIGQVLVGLDGDTTTVYFKGVATLKDSREPFNLADAYTIISADGPEGIER